jgi:solute carrier family 25 protein 34/35
VFAHHSWLRALAASTLSGVVVVLFMTPFDVVSTRLYNQGVDQSGRGLLYRGVADCFLRVYATEGVWGFYKGWGASLFRLGPHTVLSLVFWHQLQAAHKSLSQASLQV